MKYLILIHSNPAFRDIWEDLSDDQRMQFGRGHWSLTEELAESGELVISEGLADPSLARCVSLHNGQAITSDGPFAEVKEHLVGFYLVECESFQRALDIAARVPDAVYGEIEVRPIQNLSVLEH